MRILFTIDCLNRGGKERRFVEIIGGIAKKENVRCIIVVFSDVIEFDEVYHYNVPIFLLKRKSKYDLSIFYKYLKICKSFNPDVIHSQSSFTSIMSVLPAIIWKIKFVNAMITLAPDRLPIFSKVWFRSKLTFPFSNTIVSNSIAGLESFKAPCSRSVVIYNGFNFARLNNLTSVSDMLSMYSITTSKIVGMVANFTVNKDYDLYIKVAKRIISYRKDITFIAVGGRYNLQKFKDLICDNEKQYIKIIGRIENIESTVNIFDIGVMLTNRSVHGEGISNSILEYMALGKPVVASSGGGTNEIVYNNLNGYLIDGKDEDRLEAKINFLCDNSNIADEMGKEGLKLVNHKFNYTGMINKYYELFKKTR
mgnify:CR=1 FL=1|jgi:glycosyltransferase involved in cell wall biosynthesis